MFPELSGGLQIIYVVVSFRTGYPEVCPQRKGPLHRLGDDSLKLTREVYGWPCPRAFNACMLDWMVFASSSEKDQPKCQT
jgi:hypothetical protein